MFRNSGSGKRETAGGARASSSRGWGKRQYTGRENLKQFSPPNAGEIFFEFFPENWICYSYKPLELFVLIGFFILVLHGAFFDSDVYVAVALTGYV
jgi:hypothetical protein